MKRICIEDDAEINELLVKTSGFWGHIKGNPLCKMALNADKRVEVMLRGLWLPGIQVCKMLDELAD